MIFAFPEIKIRGPVAPVAAPVNPPLDAPGTETSPLHPRIEVFVLTHGSKPSVTVKTLQALGIPVQLYVNPDWSWPEDHPELQTDRSPRPAVRDYALRQYRAFKGHQAILAMANPDKFTLVFEDDMSVRAGVSPAEFLWHINYASLFLTEDPNKYEAVSFHGREQSPPQRTTRWLGREYVELASVEQTGWGHLFFLAPVIVGYQGKYAAKKFRWHEGCLGYLLGAAGRQKWLNAGHGGGMPCDLFLANELNTIVMRESILHHDQQHGSLISNTVQP